MPHVAGAHDSLRLLARPVWRERAPTHLRADHVPDPATVDVPLVLVPGVLSGDATMRSFARGHAGPVLPAGLGRNTSCSARTVDALEERVAAFVADAGRRAVVVGHSRGGQHAVVLAHRRPDLVEAVVTLGTPLRRADAMHPALWTMRAGASIAGSATGRPDLPRVTCLRPHGCCEGYRAALAHGPGPDVRFVAVRSTRDGIVDPADCVHPRARNLTTPAGHLAMVASPDVLARVAAVVRDAARPPAGRPARG